MDASLSQPDQGIQRSNALANKLTSVLSATYADSEIRDALETLDARSLQNTQETRRQLALNFQKEIISCNGDIIQDFGQVAEVRIMIARSPPSLTPCSNFGGLENT